MFRVTNSFAIASGQARPRRSDSASVRSEDLTTHEAFVKLGSTGAGKRSEFQLISVGAIVNDHAAKVGCHFHQVLEAVVPVRRGFE